MVKKLKVADAKFSDFFDGNPPMFKAVEAKRKPAGSRTGTFIDLTEEDKVIKQAKREMKNKKKQWKEAKKREKEDKKKEKKQIRKQEKQHRKSGAVWGKVNKIFSHFVWTIGVEFCVFEIE